MTIRNTKTGIDYYLWFNGMDWVLQQGYDVVGVYTTRGRAITAAKLRR